MVGFVELFSRKFSQSKNVCIDYVKEDASKAGVVSLFIGRGGSGPQLSTCSNVGLAFHEVLHISRPCG